jgi:hypothetical protein
MALRKNLMLSLLIPSLSRDEGRTTQIPIHHASALPAPRTDSVKD